MASKLTTFKNLNLIISDNSERDVQEKLGDVCAEVGILFLANDWSGYFVENKKTLNIISAVRHSTSDYLILLDDDSEITLAVVNKIVGELNRVDCVRTSVSFSKENLTNMVDMCGIFIVNSTCKDRQFWGMQALRRSVAHHLFDVRRNTLFDELTFFRHLISRGATFSYLADVSIVSHCDRSYTEFFEQRLRYSYENFAYPMRSCLFFSIIPIIIAASLLFGFQVMMFALACLSTISIFFSLVGWMASRKASKHSIVINLAAPLWVGLQSIFIWLALLRICLGGKEFSGSNLRYAA
ncbi:hypothetical protein [Burkholderia gladioli]|uniref:hypothetical protein n=1 Tax=Burkholderia gladioli TaxID=28095 RepID=UPI00163F915B|nr:hypothetical protein [Burkholderia gladioli]